MEIATGVEAVLAGDIADGSLPRANSSTLREISAPPIWIGGIACDAQRHAVVGGLVSPGRKLQPMGE